MSFLLGSTRRKLFVIGGTIGGMVVAGIAVAYFTTNGSGTGSASVGSSTALTITQTGSISGLTPGSAAKPVTFTISNPAGSGNQTLGIVSATVSSVTPTGSNTCTTANFTTSPGTVAVGQINDNSSFNSTSNTATEPTVQMVESGTNQDGCQGATVHLSFSAAQGS